jgi:hypothetical protein
LHSFTSSTSSKYNSYQKQEFSQDPKKEVVDLIQQWTKVLVSIKKEEAKLKTQGQRLMYYYIPHNRDRLKPLLVLYRN